MAHRLQEVVESYYVEDAFWAKGRLALAGLALLGWMGCAVGIAADPKRFYESYLVAFVFSMTLVIGALWFVMVQHLTGSAWSVTMRRVAENVAAVAPWGALLFIPVALGLKELYPWTNRAWMAAEPVLRGKQGYLSEPWFIGRTFVYIGLWTFWAYKVYRQSVAQDVVVSLERAKTAERWSAPGLVVLTITAALAGFDWLMSLTPKWYSSIFGVYVYAGSVVSFLALLIAILVVLRNAQVLRYSVNQEHYQDLGKWLFGMTVFWAYIGFSQYLLIWYANLPEETAWFHPRGEGAWGALSLLLAGGNFFAPFVLLISRGAKRKIGFLASVAVWMLLMHYLDIYWMAMPAFSPAGPRLHWLDAATVLAVSGTLGLAFWAKLRSNALAPVHDIRFQRSIHFRNA